jgi:hypothetical protein
MGHVEKSWHGVVSAFRQGMIRRDIPNISESNRMTETFRPS